MTAPTPCMCACHGRSDVPCSVLGGCGSEGCREGVLIARVRCTPDRCYDMHPGLCRWHCDLVSRWLAEWPELWTALHEALIPSQGSGDGRGSGEPSPGVRMDILSFLGPSGAPSLLAAGYTDEAYRAMSDQDGQDTARDFFRSWVRIVAEDRSLTVKSWTVPACREVLVRQHDWITAQPYSDDYATELHGVWRRARQMTGRIDVPELLNGRVCPWCNSNALYAEAGSDTIECEKRAGGCGERMTRDHYDQMCAMRAAHLKQTGAA